MQTVEQGIGNLCACGNTTRPQRQPEGSSSPAHDSQVPKVLRPHTTSRWAGRERTRFCLQEYTPSTIFQCTRNALRSGLVRSTEKSLMIQPEVLRICWNRTTNPGG